MASSSSKETDIEEEKKPLIPPESKAEPENGSIYRQRFGLSFRRNPVNCDEVVTVRMSFLPAHKLLAFGQQLLTCPTLFNQWRFIHRHHFSSIQYS
ncbi:hypothetical protein J6590_027203 [Homalodisca vitripennis]|nr:hypothetical protein J6590_027203 [Homalodisca vitripennis]